MIVGKTIPQTGNFAKVKQIKYLHLGHEISLLTCGDVDKCSFLLINDYLLVTAECKAIALKFYVGLVIQY